MGRPRKNNVEQIFETAEIDDTSLLQHDPTARTMSFKDPGWSDYVLSFVKDDEKKDGYVKGKALIRLIELLIGPILNDCSELVSSWNRDGDIDVISKHTFEVQDNNWEIVRKVVALGEAGTGKLTHPYNLYPAACASSKARSRAAAAVLQLKGVTTAEEVEGAISDVNTRSITETQLKGIENRCKVLNIPMMELLNKKHGAFKDVRELPYDFAVSILSFLNKVEQGEEKYEGVNNGTTL